MCEDCGCGDSELVPVAIHERILADNDARAAHLREHFVEAGVLAINLMGSPGAGKTAVLELVRRSLCEHVHVVREAASVVFGGGFPRTAELEPRRAAQRAIFYVQRELEAA
ncbi:MAG TPA: hypothetical protein VF403_06295, partial [Kofleriaceae bacterium]